MNAPSFRALDVVRVADLPPFREDGSAGREGFVRRVRRYSSEYRYEVGALGETDDDSVSGIYFEDTLIATGRRVRFSDVEAWADQNSATGQHVELLDENMTVIASGGFTIVDDLADYRE